MFEFPSVWVENSPNSLLDIVTRYCIKHPTSFCRYVSSNQTSEPICGGYKCELQEGLSLPVEICELMLKISNEELNDESLNKFFKLFKDCSRTRLRNVDVSNSAIDDDALDVLTKHRLVELNISGCKKLTKKCLNGIVLTGETLQSLILGPSVQVLLDEGFQPEKKHVPYHRMGLLVTTAEEDPNAFSIDPDIPPMSNLRRLVIHGLQKAQLNPYFNSLLTSSQYITHLDLSNCEHLGFLDCLQPLRHIVSLILCDVHFVGQCIPNICRLKSLRHLDISHTNELLIFYDNPNDILKTIVESLNNLVSLDISGTNLAGSRSRERDERRSSDQNHEEDNLTDIPGLINRVKRPLEFLGLLNTAYDACYRHHIPAKKIAGDANEAQILTAGQMYCSREPMIQKVLNDLFHIFRFSSCRNTKLALDIVMEAMRIHLKVKHIQVSGSASLFYIVKGEDKELFNIKMRRKIIKVLLDAMFSHYSDVTMLRNGCLTLIHFKIPEDVQFSDYERLVSLLLLIVAQEEQDDFVQRIGVYLLNSLACQVDGVQKQLVGDRGAIVIMLQLISKRLDENICDEVMETAWSTMWNVTDETPQNCEKFLDGGGMSLFLRCLEAFPEKPELLRNMMGLLGNVAEVKELRPRLMKDEYLSVFSDLLCNKIDGIEVSYNAAGIISHIASDGPFAWDDFNLSVKRQTVLNRMFDVIQRWNIESKRNINYRSFEPILRLLSVDNTPEAQYWAVWALANLTKVYPEKYCALLKEEGGIEMLKKLLQQPMCTSIFDKIIHELAEAIVKQCQRYEFNGGEDFEIEDSE